MHALQKYARTASLFLIVCSLLLMLPYLNKGLTFDELYTAASSAAGEPLSYLWAQILSQDINTPLYNILLHFWNLLFPAQTEITLRLPSLLCGFGALAVSFFYFPKSLGKTPRLIYFGLLAVNPIFAYYSREARCYALLLLLATVLTFYAVRLAEQIQRRQRLSYAQAAWLALLGILICYTHYFGAALFFALAATLLVYTRRYAQPVGKLLAATLATAAAFTPWLLVVFGPQRATLSDWWIKSTVAEFLTGTAQFLFAHAVTGAIVCALSLLGAWLLYKKRELFSPVTVLPLAAVGAVLAFILLCLPWVNLLYPRYMLAFFPAVYLLAARMLGALIQRDRWLIAGVPVLLFSFMYPSTFADTLSPRRGFNPTKDAVRHLAQTNGGNDLFAFVDQLNYPPAALDKLIHYYPTRFGLTVRLLPQDRAALDQRLNAGEWVNIWVPIPTKNKSDKLARELNVRVADVNTRYNAILVARN